MRDARMVPLAGDVLKRWGQCVLITRVEQGCVFSQPSLSAHKDWVGILFYREWAKGADVVFTQPERELAPPSVPLVEGKDETIA